MLGKRLGFPYYGWLISVHTAVLRVALQFNISLVFYSEDGEVEYGGNMKNAFIPTRDYKSDHKKHYFSGLGPEDLVKYGISSKDIKPYMAPDNKELDDFIIARSDGSPTYNFVVAVDDSDMNITHVIRGDDHLANTPKQILVYKALGLAIPTFAHLPMILGSDKKRLSKRHAATNVQEYREKGFTPRSIINYLSLLGWNPDSDQEIFDVKELINAFNFSQVQKKPATFDEKKLLWVSGQQMAKTETIDVIKEIETLDNNWGINQDSQYKKAVISLVKDRSKTLIDLIEMSNVFFDDSISYNKEMGSKVLDDNAIQIIKDLYEALSIEENWIRSIVESAFDNLTTQHEVGLGKIIKPVRFALTGLGYGPGIFDMMILLGKDRCLERLSKAIKL